MPQAVLALDQGTTGSTALVLSREGEVLGRSTAELTQHYPHPGWVEHDPEEIWRVSLRVMAEAVAKAKLGAKDLAALGVTNQRETTVLWHRKTGEPVYPAIVWQSRQTVEICERLKSDGLEGAFREKTGLVVDAYFSGTKARWILDRDPQLRDAAGNGEVLFGTVDSWLLWKLTGGAVHATEPTNASRTLMYDIHRRRWDEDLLAMLDLPEAMLPEVLPSAGIFGETVPAEGLAGGIPVTGMAGDQQAALFGQCCWGPGEAKNTYGTGCFLLMNMGSKSPISRHGLLTTVCCGPRGEPAYALEGSVFSAGATVQWLRDGLGILSAAAETEDLARSIDDTGGVYLVPAFAGLGAPYWDPGARGALLGLTRGSGRAQLARAALESIAFQSLDVAEAMNADSGVPLTELRADGGASANDFLMQLQADLLGVPVDRPELVETTAAGSAFLAGLAVGLWQDPEELRGARRSARRFTPRMEPARRKALLEGWHRAVERVRSS